MSTATAKPTFESLGNTGYGQKVEAVKTIMALPSEQFGLKASTRAAAEIADLQDAVASMKFTQPDQQALQASALRHLGQLQGKAPGHEMEVSADKMSTSKVGVASTNEFAAKLISAAKSDEAAIIRFKFEKSTPEIQALKKLLMSPPTGSFLELANRMLKDPAAINLSDDKQARLRELLTSGDRKASSALELKPAVETKPAAAKKAAEYRHENFTDVVGADAHAELIERLPKLLEAGQKVVYRMRFDNNTHLDPSIADRSKAALIEAVRERMAKFPKLAAAFERNFEIHVENQKPAEDAANVYVERITG